MTLFSDTTQFELRHDVNRIALRRHLATRRNSEPLVFLIKRKSNFVVTLFSDTTQFELRCDESYYVVSKIEIRHDANNCVVSQK